MCKALSHLMYISNMSKSTDQRLTIVKGGTWLYLTSAFHYDQLTNILHPSHSILLTHCSSSSLHYVPESLYYLIYPTYAPISSTSIPTEMNVTMCGVRCYSVWARLLDSGPIWNAKSFFMFYTSPHSVNQWHHPPDTEEVIVQQKIIFNSKEVYQV